MQWWRSWPALLRTRSGLTAGAAALVALAVLVGATVSLSRPPPAHASLAALRRAAAERRLTPVVAAMPAPSPQPPVLALQEMTPEQALAANQAIPVSTLPNPAAKPFSMAEAADEDKVRAQTCLAQAVYYEAGFEPLAGEQAVAQVVLNRLRHPVYPKTVCGVVFQGSELKTGCQFTFTCDGALDRTPEPVAWARAMGVAQAALNGYVMKAVGEATHYHTQYVVPYWSPTLVKLTQIGQHIFYRWTGTFGQPPAFAGQYAGNEPGAAAPTPVVSLAPVEALAVVYGKPATAPVSSQAVATTASTAQAFSPAATTPAEKAAPAAPQAPALELAVTPVQPLKADEPKVATVAKVFIPSEGLVPRPKFRPF